MRGYVYVLTNSAFPGLVKIGRTSNSPDERAAELSSTGVPHRFVVAYYELFENCIEAERKVHAALAVHRGNGDREFFSVPAKTAILCVQATEGKASDETPLSIDEADLIDSPSERLDFYIARFTDRLAGKACVRFGLFSRTDDHSDIFECKGALAWELSQYYEQAGRRYGFSVGTSDFVLVDGAELGWASNYARQVMTKEIARCVRRVLTLASKSQSCVSIVDEQTVLIDRLSVSLGPYDEAWVFNQLLWRLEDRQIRFQKFREEYAAHRRAALATEQERSLRAVAAQNKGNF
jgi:hypothetical protein